MTDAKKMGVDVEQSLGFLSTNGRLKPATPVEKAGVKSKKFFCKVCQKEVIKPIGEFGEVVLCEVCGCLMFEKI